MTEEERIRRAFKMLFYNLDKTREKIKEIEKKQEEFEQRLSNLYKIGDN